MIVYDSLCNFLQVAAYMNFAVQIFYVLVSADHLWCLALLGTVRKTAKPSSKSIQYEMNHQKRIHVLDLTFVL